MSPDGFDEDFREWELKEDLEDSIDVVERLTLAVNQHLGQIDRSVLLDLLDQVRRMRVRLDRLAYAVEAAAPLTDLNDQIAETTAADRLLAERLRAQTKGRS